MGIKKLADGPLTMTITSADLTEGNYGTQVRFVGMEAGATEDTVTYISERSAIRQLERLGLTLSSCAGSTVRMEHINKDGRTYTNFAKVGDAETSHVATTGHVEHSAPRPSAPVSGDLFARYSECLNQAARAVITMSDETGVAITGSDVVAAAATLFIQSSRR